MIIIAVSETGNAKNFLRSLKVHGRACHEDVTLQRLMSIIMTRREHETYVQVNKEDLHEILEWLKDNWSDDFNIVSVL